jgi:hypothetical protein
VIWLHISAQSEDNITPAETYIKNALTTVTICSTDTLVWLMTDSNNDIA